MFLVSLFLLGSCATPLEKGSAKDINSDELAALYNSYSSSKDYDIKTVGILLFDGVNSLDAMGPAYIFGTIPNVQTQMIGVEPGPITTAMGAAMVPATVIDSVQALDILIIPGGYTSILSAYDERLHDWIIEIDKTSTFTTAVCSGGWVLGATGLLKGRKATTNWYRAKEFMNRYGAEFVKERYVMDGKYWTSAGVTAGIDMSLAMINHIYGQEYTQSVMLDLEYDPSPPIQGGSPDKTSPLIYEMMLSRYDGGIMPLMDSLERSK